MREGEQHYFNYLERRDMLFSFPSRPLLLLRRSFELMFGGGESKFNNVAFPKHTISVLRELFVAVCGEANRADDVTKL